MPELMKSQTMMLLDEILQNLEGRFVLGEVEENELRGVLRPIFGEVFAELAYGHMHSIRKHGG